MGSLHIYPSVILNLFYLDMCPTYNKFKGATTLAVYITHKRYIKMGILILPLNVISSKQGSKVQGTSCAPNSVVTLNHYKEQRDSMEGIYVNMQCLPGWMYQCTDGILSGYHCFRRN